MFKKQWVIGGWAPLGLLVSLGCAGQDSASLALGGQATAVKVGNGPAQASVVVQPRYQLDAIAHSWVSNDIFEYDVTLAQSNASGTLTPAGTSSLLVLAQKGGTPKSVAQFSGLGNGFYLASIVAKGNPGGTDASLQLTRTATATVDLSVNNQATASAALTFLPVAFAASGTLTMTPPASDAVFINPTGTARVNVQ